MKSKVGATGLVWVTVVGYAAGAVAVTVSAFRIDVPPLRSAQMPGIMAIAVVTATLALLAAMGLLMNRILLFECGALVVGFLVGNYASDSLLGFPVAASAIVLFVAYRRRRDDAKTLPPRRLAIVAISALLGIAALWATHYQARLLLWQRTREGARTVSITTTVIVEGDCGTQPKHSIDSEGRDSGCDAFLPHPAAFTASALTAACALLALYGARTPPVRPA